MTPPGLLIGIPNMQRVDLEHHTWANYFLAAYKVSLFAACLPAMSLVSLPHPEDHLSRHFPRKATEHPACQFTKRHKAKGCSGAVIQLTMDYADT